MQSYTKDATLQLLPDNPKIKTDNSFGYNNKVVIFATEIYSPHSYESNHEKSDSDLRPKSQSLH